MENNASRLVYGTYKLPSDYSEFRRMLSFCFSSGIEWIDTAPIYNRGVSECWISNWERDSSHRFKVATKAGKFYGSDGTLQVSNTPEELKRSVKESLRRLKRERLELLFVHDYEDNQDGESLSESLVQLLTEGLIQNIGLSNFPIDITQYLINEERVNCIQISCLDLNIEDKVSLAIRNNLGHWIYRPFNKGKSINNECIAPEEVIEYLMQKYPTAKIVFGATKLSQLEWLKKIK